MQKRKKGDKKGMFELLTEESLMQTQGGEYSRIFVGIRDVVTELFNMIAQDNNKG